MEYVSLKTENLEKKILELTGLAVGAETENGTVRKLVLNGPLGAVNVRPSQYGSGLEVLTKKLDETKEYNCTVTLKDRVLSVKVPATKRTDCVTNVEDELQRIFGDEAKITVQENIVYKKEELF